LNLHLGHDKGVDFWAYGVLIFELLFGKTPFTGSDQITMFKRIVQVKYKFPPGHIITDASQDIIQHLIVKNLANRLGCLANADYAVRENDFFQGIDTEKLLAKKIQAPWVPSIRDPFDTSHFDSYKHIEQEEPTKGIKLSPKQQEHFVDF